MKVGLVTYNLAKDMDVDEIIDACTKSKIQGVELRATHAHKVELDLNKSQRADVKKKFQDSAVELMGLGSAYDYHTPDPSKLRKDIEATKEYIVLAHDVGATGIKVRPNGFPDGVPREKTLEQIGKSLREVAAFGSDYGVQIRLEVHGRDTCYLPNIKIMMDHADHPNAGVCWNSNMQDLEGEGFDFNFNLVKDKIFSVHMRDLCDETYPYRHLLQRLNETGFEGYCLAELHHTNPDPVLILKYFRCMFLAYQGLL
ncbi:MAG: sugar phosphate isomerase/epimerase [Candidatus Omnitrophica bacterium]|nr:sugar phosphate isomerase/epimerase [Candidatus Omnitrophota bacterium]